jgi:glyoxylase-like metal-dependent hydrolase (beta-lactamase superfamily II)
MRHVRVRRRCLRGRHPVHARTLYRSIRRILELPANTRLYMCHDYLPEGRADYSCVTSVAEERAHNVHISDAIDETRFVRFRESRDAELAAPRLLLPSVQFNMRGAEFPPPEANGTRYLKIPVRGLPRSDSADRAA